MLDERLVARITAERDAERRRDNRSQLRQNLDGHRDVVLVAYALGVSWQGIGRILADEFEIYGPDQQPLSGDRLRRLCDAMNVLTGQPDPSAPEGTERTTNWCPLHPRRRGHRR